MVDKHIRLFHLIRSRIAALEWQRDYFVSKGISFDNDVFMSHIAALNSLLVVRLDNNYTICNEAYLSKLSCYNVFPKSVKDHSVLLFGGYIKRRSTMDRDILNQESYIDGLKARNVSSIEIKNENRNLYRMRLLKLCMNNLVNKCLIARKAETYSRVCLELEARVAQGWYIVFNTLTVDASNYNKVFDKDSTAWTDYVRYFDRQVGIKRFGSWKLACDARREGREFHTYFAVTEKGLEHGRLHIHVLHFFSHLPDFCGADPNAGRSYPSHHEINRMKKWWSFGTSTPIAVRFDNSDAYAKLNWRWPLEFRKKGDTRSHSEFKPLKCHPPIALCRYMNKYLLKSYSTSVSNMRKDQIKWRTKMSRSLGKVVTTKIVKNSSEEQLELMCRVSRAKAFLVQRRPLPLRMMQRQAMTELLSRLKKKTPWKWWTTVLLVGRREGIIKRLKDMIHGKLTSKIVSSGDARLLLLRSLVGFDLGELIRSVDLEFFGLPKVSLANICGNTAEVCNV